MRGRYLKDNKVDKILRENGYAESEKYYSPISMWFFFWAMLCISSGFFMDVLGFFTFKNAFFLIVVYFSMSYVVIALLNRSFAITPDKLLVINSHFPFKCVAKYDLSEIDEVSVDKANFAYLLILFGFKNLNYVQVNARGRKGKHYCLFLEIDSYEEAFTEKTLDDFHCNLARKGVKVDFRCVK